MTIDLSRFKVIHGERVLNAVALIDARMKEDEDGNLVSIADEAWTFQFIPIVGKG